MTDDERIGALQQAVVEAVNESCLPLGVKALVLENLLLRVTVAGKTGWRREGKDLYSTAKIPFTTAVLGGEVPIRTLCGTPAPEPPAPGGESA